MITTTHELRCTNCEKTEEYIDTYPHNLHKPKGWHTLGPDYTHCQWYTSDFSMGGNFCSPECIIVYVQEAVYERDNPKPFAIAGDFTTGEVWGGELE